MRTYVSLALVAALFAVTVARNAVWADDGRLWADIIEKSPRKARAYSEYGLHLLETGDLDNALRLLNRSLQLNRYQPQLYVNIGLAFDKRNDLPRAISYYEGAIFVQPNDPTGYYNLGVLYYMKLKDRDRAYGYFTRARDLDPREPDVHHFLANIYQERGDAARASQEMALYERYKIRY